MTTARTRALFASLLLAAAATASGAPPGAPSPGVRVLNDDASYPEGPVWYQGRLYYVEYGRNTITTWDGRRNATFSTQPGCGHSAVVPTARGDFLVTCYDNGTIGRLAPDGKVLAPYTRDRDGRPFVGPNDFAPDRHGGVYFTTSGSHGDAIDGKVFYIAPDGTITLKVDDVHNANGIAVSNDGTTLYVVETDENRVLKFRIGSDGRVSDRRIFVNLDDLAKHRVHIWPDGIKIDSRGQIYIGQSAREYHVPYAGVIFVVDEHGRELRELTLPSVQVPNFAFSPDGRTLYVTALDQFDKPPYRGKVYALPLP
jgi:sugar lactone lactonase YvrE